MSRSAPALLLLLTLPRLAAAGAFELTGYIGQALPTYDKAFSYTPPAVSGIPGVTVTQSGSFTLEGSGGLALGGGATFYFAGILGIEGRLDSADVKVEVTNPVFHVSADLPAPFPDISRDLTLTPGTVDLDRLSPVSLNLKLRTPGRFRFTLSGGGSYLPGFGFAVTQRLGIGITGVTTNDIFLGSLAYRAEASPSGEGEGRWGVNAGAGLQIALGENVALAVEARAFAFQKQTIDWSRADTGPLSPLEEALAQELEERLQPIEFNPTFFQATAGLAITF